MAYPKKVLLHEVCPRDGWQKYKSIIPTDKKIAVIRSMIDYGVKELELGIVDADDPITGPQYADIEEVAKKIVPYAKEKGVVLNVMATDATDVAQTLDMGIHIVDFFISVSDAFGSQFGMTPEKAFADMEALTKIPGVEIRLSLGAVFGCPFGDVTPIEKTLNYLKRAADMGITSFGLGDSAGKGDPILTEKILTAVLKHFSPEQILLHFHNTEGFGFANCAKALEIGITRFDVSLAGMGGCTAIPNAKGNISTEDFVNLLGKMGIDCGIDLNQCVQASLRMSEQIGNPVISSLASNTLLRMQK